MSVNDVLAKSLADSLNKKFKDTNKVAYFLDGSDTHTNRYQGIYLNG